MASEPLRLAISGASATGKSTLARALADRLSLPHIPEQARVVLRDLGADLKTLRRNPDDILDFQHRVLEYQIREERKHARGFISDRAVFDILALFIVYVESSPQVLQAFEERVRDHAREHPYTLHLLLRPDGLPVPDDGVRTPDQRHQAYLDGHFHGLFRYWNLETRTPRGSVDERVDTVLGWLGRLGYEIP